MNGLSQHERDTRDRIREAVETGRHEDARELVSDFLRNKKRRGMRRSLLRTIPGLVTVLNANRRDR